MKKKYIVIALIISMIINITSVLINLNVDNAPKDIMVSKEIVKADFNTCDNLSRLNDKVLCWRNTIREFYNYTIRDDNNKSFRDIRENGGDCYDYSIMYQKLAEYNGFKSRLIKIYPDSDKHGHGFVIIWDKNLTGYCNVDTLNINCVNLK